MPPTDPHLFTRLTTPCLPPTVYLAHTLSAGLVCFLGLLFIFRCVWGFTLVKGKATVPEWYLWIWVLPVFIARPTLVFTRVSRGLQGAGRGWERRRPGAPRGLIVDFRVFTKQKDIACTICKNLYFYTIIFPIISKPISWSAVLLPVLLKSSRTFYP